MFSGGDTDRSKLIHLNTLISKRNLEMIFFFGKGIPIAYIVNYKTVKRLQLNLIEGNITALKNTDLVSSFPNIC